MTCDSAGHCLTPGHLCRQVAGPGVPSTLMTFRIHCENMGVSCTEECCVFFTICSFTTNLKVQEPLWHVIERRYQGQHHPGVVYILSSVFYTLSSASSFIAFSLLPVNKVVFTCKATGRRKQEVGTGGLL